MLRLEVDLADQSAAIAAGRLGDAGLPALPYRDYLVVLPPGTRAVDAAVTPVGETRDEPAGDVTLAPVLMASDGGTVAQAAEPIAELSAPAAWGRLLGQFVWHGRGLATVRVHPQRVLRDTPDAAWSRRETATAFRIEVRLTADSTPRVHRRRPASDGDRASLAAVRRAALDPEALAAYGEPAPAREAAKGFAPTPLPSLEGTGVDMVIVTDETLAPTFQDLADYRTGRGQPTLVRTLDWITANYAVGEDLPATIRAFLTDAYERWGTRFVLLGGDVEIVPTRMIYSTFYPTGSGTDIPVDLYYGGLDGDWNADGDQTPGEPYIGPTVPGDDADLAAELHVGRAPVKTTTQAQLFITKIKDYERDAVNDQSANVLFMSEVLFPSDYSQGDSIDLDGASYSEEIVDNILTSGTMTSDRYYEASPLWPGSLSETRANVMAAMNSGGYGLVNHIGHGFFYDMSVGDHTLVLSDATSLTNAPHFFVLYNLNCASAAFDYNSIMERFITNPDGGAVLSVGSSRAAFPNTAAEFQSTFYAQLFQARLPTVGEAVEASRTPWLGVSETNTAERWTQLTLAVIGDPALQVWSAKPESLAVAVPDTVPLGGQTVTVNVARGGIPLSGARVCLRRGDELYATAETDLQGDATLAIAPATAGPIEATVTALNSYPWSGTMQAAADGAAYLDLESVQLFDDGTLGSVGDGDGVPEVGETLALLPTWRNSGDADLTAPVTVDLTVAAPDVTPTVASTTAPALAAGASGEAAAPLLVTIGPDVADRTEIVLSLSSADGGATCRDDFLLVAAAPKLDVGVLTWQDYPYGNGNAIIEPNELIRVWFELRNDGTGSLSGLTGWLETDTPGVNVVSGATTWPDLPGGGDVTQDLEFLVSMQTITDARRAVLHIEDDAGRSWVHDFDLQRPDRLTLDGVATEAPGEIRFQWLPSGASDLAGYLVYRSQSANSGYVKLTSSPLTSAFFHDHGLAAATRYYYRVTAVDSSGLESKQSYTATTTTSPAENAGFPEPMTTETSGHIAVGDIDGDGQLEVVSASDAIYVWNADGTEQRDGDGDPTTIGPFAGSGDTWTPTGITLADVTSDPGLEIVATSHDKRQIYVFQSDGSVAPGWPRSMNNWCWGAPAVADIDGDGSAEIAATSIQGITYVWRADGSDFYDGDGDPATIGVFQVRPSETYQFASPVLADLDHDGRREVIVGSHYTNGTPDVLYALQNDATDLPGWPFTLGTWYRTTTSPAVGDLDGDGVLEVVFITESNRLYVVEEDGQARSPFPIPFVSNNTTIACPSPALGDLDGDGNLDIVGVSVNSADDATIHAYGLDGQELPGWPRDIAGNSESSPILGDITGDGRPDVIFGIGGGTDSEPNLIYGFRNNGSDISGFPLTLTGPARATPMLTDLDRDGDVDLVYGGWDLAVHVWDIQSPYSEAATPWPTFNGNVARTGVLDDMPEATAVEAAVPVRKLALAQNVPNPFNPATRISFTLPDGFRGRVRLTVHDLQGRVVRRLWDGEMGPGEHALTWTGRDDAGRPVASGLYLYRLSCDAGRLSGRMTLVR